MDQVSGNLSKVEEVFPDEKYPRDVPKANEAFDVKAENHFPEYPELNELFMRLCDYVNTNRESYRTKVLHKSKNRKPQRILVLLKSIQEVKDYLQAPKEEILPKALVEDTIRQLEKVSRRKFFPNELIPFYAVILYLKEPATIKIIC